MTSVSEKLESYMGDYSNFIAAMGRIDTIAKSVSELEKECASQQQECDRQIQIKNNYEDEVRHKKREFQQQENLYARCTGNTSVEEGRSKVTYMLNEFTDLKLFNAKQSDIRKRYEQAEAEYYSGRKQTIDLARQELVKEEEKYTRDKKSYVHQIMQDMDPDSISVLEVKKQDVVQYLTANKKISDSDISAQIQDAIKTDEIDARQCGTSASVLLKQILSLKGTEQYPREQHFDLKFFKANRSEFQSNSYYIFLGVIAVALFVLFMLGFTPLWFLIPSTYDIAGASGAVARVAVRILVGLFWAAVFYGIPKLILHLTDHDTAGNVVGGIAGVIAFLHVFLTTSSGITTQNMMGFGGVVHFIVAFIVNLLLVIGIVALLAVIIVNTPLASLFFKNTNDTVLAGLKSFQSYFQDNRFIYDAMFHYEEAIGYAFENGLHDEIADKDRELSNVVREEGYVSLESRKESELQTRMDERKRQVNAIRQKRDNLRQDINSLNEKLSKVNQIIRPLNNTISDLRDRIQLQKNQHRRLLSQTEATRKKLLRQTGEIIDKSDQDFEAKCRKINNVHELIACNGQLSRQIYFVRKEKDKYGMAVLRKTDLRCRHTVFVYNKNDIQGNNLSEELCPFIKWYAEAIRRTNPGSLLAPFQVVDVMSGKSVLTMPPFNQYISVVDDDTGKRDLANMLQQEEMKIIHEVSQPIIQKEGLTANSVSALNAVKMKINKQEIELEPDESDISIEDLAEKLFRYHVLIFIVPGIVEEKTQPSVLNSDLQRVLMNADRYGIVPVFLVDSETWKDTRISSDISYLHGIKQKTVTHIFNVGRNNEKLLDI